VGGFSGVPFAQLIADGADRRYEINHAFPTTRVAVVDLASTMFIDYAALIFPNFVLIKTNPNVAGKSSLDLS
jgi:hypothetical protein